MKKTTPPIITLAGIIFLTLLVAGGGLALRGFAGNQTSGDAIEEQSAAIMKDCCKKKEAEKPVQPAQTNAAPAKSHCGSCKKQKNASPETQTASH